MEIAERIRREVADRTFDVETSSEPIRATISVGVAAYPRDGQDANELIHQADLAVYRAKLQGRNRALDASAEPLARAERPKARLAAVPEDGRPPRAAAAGVRADSARGAPASEDARGSRTALSLALVPARAPGRLRVGRGHRRGRRWASCSAQTTTSSRSRPRRARRLRPGARDRGGRRRLDLGQRSRLPRRCCPVRPPGGARPRGHDRGRRMERPPVARSTACLQHRRAHARLARSRLRVRGRVPRAPWREFVIAAAGLVAGLAYFAVNTGLLSVAISMEGHERVRRVWRERFAWLLPHWSSTASSAA